MIGNSDAFRRAEAAYLTPPDEPEVDPDVYDAVEKELCRAALEDEGLDRFTAEDQKVLVDMFFDKTKTFEDSGRRLAALMFSRYIPSEDQVMDKLNDMADSVEYEHDREMEARAEEVADDD